MVTELDFKGLASALLSDAQFLVPKWLPGGRMQGREYCVASLRGGAGNSCKVNFSTGAWADFAGEQTERGGDLISLYATIERISNAQAARTLAKEINFKFSDDERMSIPKPAGDDPIITPAPEGAIVPNMASPRNGEPSMKWCYRSEKGVPIFWVARYETPEGKQFTPFSWSQRDGRWIAKGFPAPRPLYNLDKLAARPAAPVLVVEGEKAAEAAEKMAGPYVVTTWHGGSNSVAKSDWSALKGRKVLIWPDKDEPGFEAADKIASILQAFASEVKLIQFDFDGEANGWDAADALEEGWDWPQFRQFAIPRLKLWIASTNGAAVASASVTVNAPDEEEAPPSNIVAIYEQIGIATTRDGKAIANMDNALRVLEGYKPLMGIAWYDEFYKRYYTKWNTDRVREWNDVDTLNLTGIMQRDLGMSRIGDDAVHKALIMYSNKNKRNAVKDWMSGLKWDGVERIPYFLETAFGASPTEYHRSASKNFFLGMVARIFRPGCQADNMIVLEGPQGLGKTRALRALGGEWHTEAHESVTSKDFFMTLQGKLIVEIAEMDSFSRAEVTRIKQVVSCPNDRYRAPYGRTAEDHPRMSVFVGTTNELAYLRDNTGGRRFWPIRCTQIDVDFIVEHRDQLFAEAVHRFKSNEDWYQMPYDETKKAQEARRVIDEWEHIISDWVNTPPRRYEVTSKEVATECLKIELGRIDRNVQLRIASSLRANGFLNEVHSVDGTSKRLWVRPNTESDISSNTSAESSLF